MYQCNSNIPADLAHFKQMNQRASEIPSERRVANHDLSKIASNYRNYQDKSPDSTYWRKHCNTELYGPLLSHLKNKPVNLLEIGVRWGGSILMWQDFFIHPNSIIHGADIDFSNINKDISNKINSSQKIKLYEGNAYTQDFVCKNFGDSCFDIILDDGSHTEGDQIKFFNLYISLLNDGGYLMAEDFHSLEQARNVIDKCDLNINNMSIILRNHCIPSGKGEMTVLYKA